MKDKEAPTSAACVQRGEYQSKGICWHAWHNLLVAQIFGMSFEQRVAVILKYKPKHEHETRLRLLTPVEDGAVIKWVEDVYTSNTYRAARSFLRNPPQFVLDAHKRECVEDCPWDGKTIFPEEDEDE